MSKTKVVWGKSGIAFFEGSSWGFRYKERLEDGKTKYGKIKGYATEQEAVNDYYIYEEKFKEQNREYEVSVNKDIMFIDYLIYWFENIYSIGIEQTTKMIGAYTVYKFMIPNIEEDIKIKFVTAEYLNVLLKRISTSNVKSAPEKAREIMSGLLKEAHTSGIITYNPIGEVDYYSRNSKKITILTKAQLKKFLEMSSKENWYLEILLGVFCGLRRGEIQGLKFSDFNYEEKSVIISRQLVSEYTFADDMEVKGFKITDYTTKERDPKTINAFRKLRVPDVVIEQVKNRYKLMEYYKMKDKEYEDDDYISFQPNGKPHGINSFNHYIKSVCRKTGLPIITVHSLRHMFATILAEQGVELAKISGLLGHNSIHTTFEFYCDVMEDTENINAYMNREFVPEEEQYAVC